MAADATGIREYKGAAKATTIVAGITNTSTSWSIADSTGWPTGSVGNFVVTLEQGLSTEERILCSALAGGVLTVVTRGYDNTTAVAHAATSSISHTISAIDIAEANYIANFHALTSKTTPVDADEIPLADSAASFGLKKLTWANLKATFLAWFWNFATQATAASTKTLVVTDAKYQEFTGTIAAQIVVMPVTSTLGLGMKFTIDNNSTQSIAVQSSGANAIATIPAGGKAILTVILITGTTAASWLCRFMLPNGNTAGYVLVDGGAGAAPTWAAAASGGKVVQIVTATYSTYTSSSSSGYVDTGLTATITPTSASNKVLVFFSQNGVYLGAGNTWVQIQLLRGASILIVPADRAATNGSPITNNVGSVSAEYLDSPATTAATTYKTQFCSGNNVASAHVQHSAAVSTIVLMEVTP